MNESFGHLYRQLRRKQGVTQKEVSRRLGISQAKLSKMENLKAEPTFTEFFSLCRYFEIRPEYFYDSFYNKEN